MTTQIHKFHTRDTEEQLYDVPLHDVELNDVANVRHKSASSCVPSWLHENLAHYLMLFLRKADKHNMPRRGRRSNVAAAIPVLYSPRAKHL